MYEDSNTVKIRRVIFFLTIGVIILIGWLVYNGISTQGTIAVSLKKAPYDIKVTLNNSEIKGNSIRLKPGEYTFTVTRDGFYKKDITASVNEEEGDSVALLLTPETEEAKKLVADDEKYHYDHALSAGDVLDPILDRLPIRNVVYSIDSAARDEAFPSTPIPLTISAAKGYRNAAIRDIENKGLTPSNYVYTFVNYKDPF